MCKHPVFLTITLAALAAPALAGPGLAAPEGAAVWPQWQARLTLSTATWTPLSLTGAPESGSTRLQSGALLGDYYFDMPGLRLPSSLGGLRASSGVLLGARGLALGSGPSLRAGPHMGLALQSSSLASPADGSVDAVPYFGVGYTGQSAKGGFSITADLGLVAERPSGAAGVGRALLGTQGLERALRELRLSPVLQVGVSYSF